MSRKHPTSHCGLTWPQVCVLRRIAEGSRQGEMNGRAVWSLSKRRVPLIDSTRHVWVMTPKGRVIWRAIVREDPGLLPKEPKP
jgi:hypothetical protein